RLSQRLARRGPLIPRGAAGLRGRSQAPSRVDRARPRRSDPAAGADSEPAARRAFREPHPRTAARPEGTRPRAAPGNARGLPRQGLRQRGGRYAEPAPPHGAVPPGEAERAPRRRPRGAGDAAAPPTRARSPQAGLNPTLDLESKELGLFYHSGRLSIGRGVPILEVWHLL